MKSTLWSIFFFSIFEVQQLTGWWQLRIPGIKGATDVEEQKLAQGL